MTLRRPLALVGGNPSEIPSGDTIDPAVLPASSSYPPLAIAGGVTFQVPDNTQVLYGTEIDVTGEIEFTGSGELVYVGS